MRAHHILTVLLCIFILSGCETASRNCEGFHHPLAEIWTGNDGLGEVRSFVDNAGNRKNYSLQSIDKTGPRVNKSRGSDSSMVSCLETAKYLYVQSDADIAYELDFTQRDVREGLATEDQAVTLVVNTQNPVGRKTDTNVRPMFYLTDLDLISVYFPEATIEGNNYVDLVQHTVNDNSEQFTSGLVDEEAQWVRLLVAKDVGLLQYELLNGTVYTLTRE